MDITCIPEEIKLMIISYLPIYKLINNPVPIFHEYIIHYINTQLLTNMYVSGRLLRSDIYCDIVYDKMKEMSSSITKQFMKATSDIGGTINPFNSDSKIVISLKITFKFTKVGKCYNSNTKDIKYSLSSYGSLNDSSCTWFYNDTVSAFKYTEENIKNEIWRILIKNMDHSDTTIDIKSMEMVKTDLMNADNYNVLIKFI